MNKTVDTENLQRVVKYWKNNKQVDKLTPICGI